MKKIEVQSKETIIGGDCSKTVWAVAGLTCAAASLTGLYGLMYLPSCIGFIVGCL